ncbi:shewanella-like protein phosphatase 2 [Hepatocystis sp. ex Piliocolobus tephrosceles]|nr:shewanella-like protein phosphatase 2 [Hepatocystis sp. ex Piliocolobus tephrosceles]
MKYVSLIFFIYFVALWQKSYTQDDIVDYSNIKWKNNLYSISDLHGDMNALLKILKNEKIIDNSNNILKKDTLVVITGDVLDPNYDDINILFFIEDYNIKGKSMNSKIIMLLGNHEINNICLKFKNRESDQDKYNNRNELFKKNKSVYNILINYPIVIKINNIIFSHAGVLPFYAYYGINFINLEGKKEIENNCKLLIEKKNSLQELCICCNYGPTLNRYYASVSHNVFKRNMVCSTLYKALQLLKANTMVVGHTMQLNYKANSFCGNKLLLTDTGISQSKNGVISYVKYFPDNTYKTFYIDR